LSDTRAAYASLATGTLEVTLDSLLAAVDGHDSYTHGHSLRVSRSSAAIAEAMAFEADAVELVRDAALVHDIGKIGIPDALLRKSGKLTQDEFELLSLHPVLGASILARTPTLKHLVPAVLHHHERWDGNGYPAKLAGAETPIESASCSPPTRWTP
jgi:HD-GYP domain-containing protein (c-di-GMP phosphodiesterase class II)